jgi:hypothetical protein
MTNHEIKSLEILSKLANIKFQQKVWLKNEQWDEVLNLGEAINSLDDYSFFDDLENGNLFVESGVQQNELNAFSDLLLNYEEPASVSEMLKDPNWLKIVNSAKSIVEQLNNID